MSDKKGYWLYDTEEVVEKEEEAYCKKLGRKITFEEDGEIVEQYLESELNIFKKEFEDSPESALKRLDLTVEDDEGQIWICVKLLNINRLQKLLGTEP